jgi:hypothetical protein
MCPPLPLSPTAELVLANCSFLKRDFAILSVCDLHGIVRVKDVLRELNNLHTMFNPEQVAVLHGLLVDLQYSLEKLGLDQLKA